MCHDGVAAPSTGTLVTARTQRKGLGQPLKQRQRRGTFATGGWRARCGCRSRRRRWQARRIGGGKEDEVHGGADGVGHVPGWRSAAKDHGRHRDTRIRPEAEQLPRQRVAMRLQHPASKDGAGDEEEQPVQIVRYDDDLGRVELALVLRSAEREREKACENDDKGSQSNCKRVIGTMSRASCRSGWRKKKCSQPSKRRAEALQENTTPF